MAREAIKMLVSALRVRLHLLIAPGADWNIENLYENDCQVAVIMDHINVCGSVRGQRSRGTMTSIVRT
jgi:hypothetical protein